MRGFQKPITVMSAMTSIRDRSYLLPAIQRRFVWSHEQVEALFDSLMRGYPISSFMLWQITDPVVKKSVRFYDFLQRYRQRFHEQNAEVRTHGHKDFFAVIDGQQRLTALFLGLFGSYAYKLPRVWLKDSEENLPTRRLYLNLVDRRDDDDEQGMIYDFKFLTDGEVNAPAATASWFPVGDIVDFPTAEALEEHFEDQPRYGKDARRTLRTLRESVHRLEAINSYVEDDQDIDRVLDIFIRTNSGGVPLAYSDLLMSYTTAQWTTRDARAEFDALVDRIFAIGTPGFVITKDFILKACLAMFARDVRFRLANLNPEVISALEADWTGASASIVAAFEFLADVGFHERNLRGKLVVVPIAQYLFRRGIAADFAKPQKYVDEKAAIRAWLCMSVLKGVFRVQTDHLLNQLRKLVDEGASSAVPHFPLEEICETFRSVPSRSLTFDDDFVAEMLRTSMGEAVAFPLLSLLYSHLDYARQRMDVDHLHPAAEIERIRRLPRDQRSADWAFVTDEANWNSIANLQPLNESLNRSKQHQSLADWVAEKNIDRAAYLLPPDVGLDLPSFKPFIEARRVLLAARLREVLGTPRPRRSPG